MIPDYWLQAADELSSGDPAMAELVQRYAGVSLVSRGDAFGTLARSIVGQQISVKAADAVWRRFAVLIGEVTPQCVLELGPSGLEPLGRRGDHCRTDGGAGHRPVDGGDVSDFSPVAPRRFSA